MLHVQCGAQQTPNSTLTTFDLLPFLLEIPDMDETNENVAPQIDTMASSGEKKYYCRISGFTVFDRVGAEHLLSQPLVVDRRQDVGDS